MRDSLGGIFIGGFVVSFLCFVGYEAYAHPCIQYQAVFVPGHYETEFMTQYCGKDCQISIPYEAWISPHWNQQCMAYGDRSKGDVEADYAPIKAEQQ